MGIERILYDDRLMMFDMFKRQFLRYSNQHRRTLISTGGANRKFFESMQDEDKQLYWHSKQVMKELKSNIADLPAAALKVVLTELQAFLDSVYESIDNEYAKAGAPVEWHPCLPSIIPKLQNQVKAELKRMADQSNPGQSATKKPKQKSKLNSFEDLFVSNRKANQALLMLKRYPPTVVDTKNNYTASQCGAITAWIEILKTNHYFKDGLVRADAVPILKKKIKGLHFSDRQIWGPNQSEQYKKYKVIYQLAIYDHS